MSERGRSDASFQANLAMVQMSRQHQHEWLQTATRFIVLANAGGAVATLSFLGTSMANGVTFKLALVPLACFVVGILLAGLVLFGRLQISWEQRAAAESMGQVPRAVGPLAWVVERTYWWILAAFCFFALGAIIGIVALWMF